jgi:hypothetical protein
MTDSVYIVSILCIVDEDTTMYKFYHSDGTESRTVVKTTNDVITSMFQSIQDCTRVTSISIISSYGHNEEVDDKQLYKFPHLEAVDLYNIKLVLSDLYCFSQLLLCDYSRLTCALHIDSKRIQELVASVSDNRALLRRVKNCIVYMSDKGEWTYFKDLPKMIPLYV